MNILKRISLYLLFAFPFFMIHTYALILCDWILDNLIFSAFYGFKHIYWSHGSYINGGWIPHLNSDNQIKIMFLSYLFCLTIIFVRPLFSGIVWFSILNGIFLTINAVYLLNVRNGINLESFYYFFQSLIPGLIVSGIEFYLAKGYKNIGILSL